MNHNENGIGSGTIQVIADYEVERWLHTLSLEDQARTSEDPDWQQLTQYAAYHAINGWYSLPVASRSLLALTQLFERKWTNKVSKFGSEATYREVKHRVLTHLYDVLRSDSALEWPHLLFESIDVWMEELQMGLSMIIQVMAPSEKSFVIHKYVMDDGAASLALFTHMSIVFCHKAFGVMPEALQIVNLMSGMQQRIETKDFIVEQSIDYIRLVKDVYLESRTCGCCVEEGLHGNKSNMAIHQ
ncbi:hypothetical protein A8709_15835 [Paenibacillus pectinilyticus]|uniref:Uncharacterized protein n=1 Tax=Paenibacillus pectinilyticus TaxID=512399 RepID=A0A1C1A4R7_9BACL|nr:hypothetical protein [Paenibacillus pectinilyticus]OCT15545.1 hypothetical protein A8709_15835 [Paenibacillus pectinilyticus]